MYDTSGSADQWGMKRQNAGTIWSANREWRDTIKELLNNWHEESFSLPNSPEKNTAIDKMEMLASIPPAHREQAIENLYLQYKNEGTVDFILKGVENLDAPRSKHQIASDIQNIEN